MYMVRNPKCEDRFRARFVRYYRPSFLRCPGLPSGRGSSPSSLRSRLSSRDALPGSGGLSSLLQTRSDRRRSRRSRRPSGMAPSCSAAMIIRPSSSAASASGNVRKRWSVSRVTRMASGNGAFTSIRLGSTNSRRVLSGRVLIGCLASARRLRRHRPRHHRRYRHRDALQSQNPRVPPRVAAGHRQGERNVALPAPIYDQAGRQ